MNRCSEYDRLKAQEPAAAEPDMSVAPDKDLAGHNFSKEADD